MTSRNFISLSDKRKDKRFQTQMKIVFAAFKKAPSTMLMVEVSTGIMRPNICRYVRQWRKAGKIQKIKEGICPISKCRAGFFSTDPKLFPEKMQMKIFE